MNRQPNLLNLEIKELAITIKKNDSCDKMEVKRFANSVS
jgi:hypothetical protein